MEQSPLSSAKWKLFPGKFSSPPMSAGETYCLLGLSLELCHTGRYLIQESALGTAPFRQAPFSDQEPALGIAPFRQAPFLGSLYLGSLHQMFGISILKDFKVTLINIFKPLKENIVTMKEQMGKLNRETETIKRGKWEFQN